MPKVQVFLFQKPIIHIPKSLTIHIPITHDCSCIMFGYFFAIFSENEITKSQSHLIINLHIHMD